MLQIPSSYILFYSHIESLTWELCKDNQDLVLQLNETITVQDLQ